MAEELLLFFSAGCILNLFFLYAMLFEKEYHSWITFVKSFIIKGLSTITNNRNSLSITTEAPNQYQITDIASLLSQRTSVFR